ncbi:MAG: GNAT family N-acetyltransferase [Collinsella sp.]|nr:GNAT family N-acetyltransferase [Collinsella sp.]
MRIERATVGDLPRIEMLYRETVEAMHGTPEDIEWDMSWHPTPAGLARRVAAGELFQGACDDGSLAGAFVLNGEQAPAYAAVPWPHPAAPAEVAVLHLLAVSPRRRGRGIGRLLVEGAIEAAQSGGFRVLRLDVLANNVPAVGLYRVCGMLDLGPRDMEVAPGFVRRAHAMEMALA